jgi:hypothetical protein
MKPVFIIILLFVITNSERALCNKGAMVRVKSDLREKKITQ